MADSFVRKSPEQYKAERETIIKKLEQGVQDVYESDAWKKFLDFYSRFHNYSINNCILIQQQFPSAEQVAPYDKWKELHRHILKGERGIKVLVPTPKKVKVDEGTPNEREVKKMYFKIGHVFDISQTEADGPEGEVPQLVLPLQSNPLNLWSFIDEATKKLSVPVIIGDVDPSMMGYYDILSESIHIRQGLSSLQTLKTLVHELSHWLQETRYAKEIAAYDRRSKEVVAESCAYTVLSMLQYEHPDMILDTSSYSFPYIAGWAGDKELSVLKSTLGLIGKISNMLFEMMDKLYID